MCGNLEALTELMEDLRLWLSEQAVSEDVAFAFLLAVEELATNSIKYGKLPQVPAPIGVDLVVEDTEITLHYHDLGTQFDPFKAPEPDLDAPASEREPGGLGIHLLRNLIDSCEYRRLADRNICTLKKSTS